MPTRKLTPNATDRITVTVDATDRAALDQLSKEADRSLAWLIREAISQYLAKRRRTPDTKQS